MKRITCEVFNTNLNKLEIIASEVGGCVGASDWTYQVLQWCSTFRNATSYQHLLHWSRCSLSLHGPGKIDYSVFHNHNPLFCF